MVSNLPSVKRRASVFDPYFEEAKKLLQEGLTLKEVHQKITEKMPVEFGFDGFYAWLKRYDLLEVRKAKSA